MFVYSREVTRRKYDLPSDARTCLGDESRHASATLAYACDRALDVHRIRRTRVRMASLELAAIHVRDRNRVNPVGRSSAARTGMLVRTDIDEARRVSMIGF